jgi:hypothetical protein
MRHLLGTGAAAAFFLVTVLLGAAPAGTKQDSNQQEGEGSSQPAPSLAAPPFAQGAPSSSQTGTQPDSEESQGSPPSQTPPSLAVPPSMQNAPSKPGAKTPSKTLQAPPHSVGREVEFSAELVERIAPDPLGPRRVTTPQLLWSCERTACQAHGAWVEFGVTSCQSLVAEVGRVRTFRSQGRTLSTDDLERCNGSVKARRAEPSEPSRASRRASLEARLRQLEAELFVRANGLTPGELGGVAHELREKGTLHYVMASAEADTAGEAMAGLDLSGASSVRALVSVRKREGLRELGDGRYADAFGDLYEYGSYETLDHKTARWANYMGGLGDVYGADYDDDGIVDLLVSSRRDPGLRRDRLAILANEKGLAFLRCFGLGGVPGGSQQGLSAGGGISGPSTDALTGGSVADPCRAQRPAGHGSGSGSGSHPVGSIDEQECEGSEAPGRTLGLIMSEPHTDFQQRARHYRKMGMYWEKKYRAEGNNLIGFAYREKAGANYAAAEADEEVQAAVDLAIEAQTNPDMDFDEYIYHADRAREVAEVFERNADVANYQGNIRENAEGEFYEAEPPHEPKHGKHGGSPRPDAPPPSWSDLACDRRRAGGWRTLCQGLDALSCMRQAQDATLAATGGRCHDTEAGPDDRPGLACKREEPEECSGEDEQAPGCVGSGPTDAPRRRTGGRSDGAIPVDYIQTTPLGAFIASFCQGAGGLCPEDFGEGGARP